MRKALSIVIIFMIMLAGCGTAGTADKGESPYDYYAECLTREQVKELSEKPFIKSVFPFTLMIFQRPGHGNATEGQFAVLAAPSFENMEYSPFSRDDIIEEDPEILGSPEKEPIIIDEALAKDESLSVGDTLEQQVSVEGGPLRFTVGAIYRHTQLFAQYDAVTLSGGQIERIFGSRMEETGYTNAYIKASDADALKAYMENEFVPALDTRGMTEEEIRSVPREAFNAYYEDYETHINRMNGDI